MLSIAQITRLSLHNGSVYALVKGENEDTFLSGGSEGIVVKWDIQQPDKAVAIAKVNGQIFSLLLLPEQNHLVIGTMSGGLHVIDLNHKKEIHYITFHDQSIFDIKLYDQKLLVASKDGTLSIWSTADYSFERVITVSDQSLRMLDIHPSITQIAVGCSDNSISLIDPESWKIEAVLHGPENSVFSVCYSPGGDKLLAGSRDAQLYVYDLKSNRLEMQIKAHLYTINHIQFIAGNKLFATASRDKTIRIWDASSFDLLKSIDKVKDEGHKNSVNRILWLPVHNYLVSASDDRSIITWKIEISES